MTAKGDLTTEIINPVLASLEIEGQKERIQNIYNGLGEYFAKADKIVIKQLKGQNNSYEIHNPVVAPLSIEGKSFGVANMENYTLELGGKINGIMTVKEGHEGWVVDTGKEVVIENIHLIATKGPKEPGIDFDNLAEEYSDPWKDDASALAAGLYENKGDFNFLDAVTSGTVRITLFGQIVNIPIFKITSDGTTEYGFIDLKTAVEGIGRAISTSGEVNTNENLGYFQRKAFTGLTMDQKDGNYIIELGELGYDGPVIVPDVAKNLRTIDGVEFIRLSALVNYQANKPEIIPNEEESDNEVISTEMKRLIRAGNLQIQLLNIKINHTAGVNMGILESLNLKSQSDINSSINLDSVGDTNLNLGKISLINNKGTMECNGIELKNLYITYARSQNITIGAGIGKIKGLRFKINK